jgi:hypothetical protein
MVTLEFEKPSEWSIGKKIAVIAIIFLIIGAFLSFSLCLPVISIALIVFLLYLKFDIYLEKKDETRIKINHFILILWGGWFLVNNLFYLFFLWTLTRYFEFFPAIYLVGVGLTIIGFLLCLLVGLLEWRYPKGGRPRIPKTPPVITDEKPTVEVAPQPATKVVTQSESQKRIPVTTLRKEPITVVSEKPEPTTTEAQSEPEKVEIPTREITPDEYKHLLRWINHIDKNGQAFEQCMKCQNYVFMKATKTPDAIVFTCPECNEVFLYKK